MRGRRATPRLEMQATSRRSIRMETMDTLRTTALVRRVRRIWEPEIIRVTPTWVRVPETTRVMVQETCRRSAACLSLPRAIAVDSGPSTRPPAARHREADPIADRLHRLHAATVAAIGTGQRRVRPVQWD